MGRLWASPIRGLTTPNHTRIFDNGLRLHTTGHTLSFLASRVVHLQSTPVLYLASPTEARGKKGKLKVSGPLSGGFALRRFSPQGIVLRRLLYSLPNLLDAKIGTGESEFFAAFSHEGHGIKSLLLHGFAY